MILFLRKIAFKFGIHFIAVLAFLLPDSVIAWEYIGTYSPNLFNATNAIIDGKYCYVTAINPKEGTHRVEELQVLDMSDISTPKLIGKIVLFEGHIFSDWEALSLNLSFLSNHIYIGTQSGLLDIDVSNKTNPICVSKYDTSNTIYSTCLSNSNLYFVENNAIKVAALSASGSIQSFDSIPFSNLTYNATPIKISSPKQLIVQNNFMFLLDNSNGIYRINLSSPPRVTGYASIKKNAYGLALKNDQVIATYDYYYTNMLSGKTDAWQGFSIFDISDSTNLVLINNYERGTSTGYKSEAFHSVAFLDTNLLFSGEIFNFKNRTLPKLVNLIPVPFSASAIVRSGAYILFMGTNGIFIISANQIETSPESNYVFKWKGKAGFQMGSIYENHLYLTNSAQNSISIFDISNPNSTSLIDTLSFAKPYYFSIYNGKGILGTNKAVYLHMTNNNTDYDDTATIPFGQDVMGYYSLAFQGNYAFSLEGLNIKSWNITDIKNVQLLQSQRLIPTGAPCPTEILLNNNYLYITQIQEGGGSPNWGLHIVDISNPLTMTKVGSYLSGIWSRRVAVFNNNAFLTSRDIGLEILNISDVTKPTKIGNFDTPYLTYDICVADNYAYITDTDLPFILKVNIQDPTNPRLSKVFYLKEIPLKILSKNGYLYAFSDSTFYIFNDANVTSTSNNGNIINQKKKTNIFIQTKYHKNGSQLSISYLLNSELDINVEMAIYNLTGKKIYQTNCKNNDKFTLPLLTQGSYLLHFSSKKQSKYIKMVILPM